MSHYDFIVSPREARPAQGQQASMRSLAAGMTLLLAVTAACVAAGFVVLTREPAQAPTTAARTEITDGYLKGAIAANQAGRVAQAQQLTDGWEAGIVTSAGAGATNLTDGWEANLFQSVQRSQDPIGGWESQLFR